MADVFGPWIAFLGLVGLTIGVVALFKGELAWAKIHDRKNAGIVAAIGFVWMAFGSAITPLSPSDSPSPTAKATGAEPARTSAKPITRLALDRADWPLEDAETIEITGSAEPNAKVVASWLGGSTSVDADGSGAFRFSVGPLSDFGDTRVNVSASVQDKQTASQVVTINRALSEAKFKSSAQSIPYDELKKDPDALTGRLVTYKAEILQYDSRTTTASMIVSVTNNGYGFWSDSVHLLLDPALGVNADENDLIQIWGTVIGSYTYDTAMGGSNTLPQLAVQYLTVTSKK